MLLYKLYIVFRNYRIIIFFYFITSIVIALLIGLFAYGWEMLMYTIMTVVQAVLFTAIALLFYPIRWGTVANVNDSKRQKIMERVHQMK